MRLLGLTLQGFGPFANVQTVDFEALSGHLFLINGVTGAGKSSLLDAVCFALYGEAVDKDRTETLRCHHAAADTLTEVSLSFELGTERYQILRQPKQRRPKLRGEGFTDQEHKAWVWRLDASGKQTKLLCSEKVELALEFVHSHFGLNVKQFRQVMILPQGKFRELLLTDSKDREEILSQLFDTSEVQAFEQQLSQAAKALETKVKTSLSVQQQILERLKFDSKEQLKNALEQSTKQHAEHSSKLKAAQDELAKLQQDTHAAAQLNQQHAELEALTQTLTHLEAEEPNIQQSRLALEQAQAAQPLVLLHRSEQTELARLKEERLKLSSCTASLEALQAQSQHIEELKVQLETLALNRDAALNESKDAQRYAEVHTELQRLASAQVSTEHERNEKRTFWKTTEQRLSELGSNLEALKLKQAKLSSAQSLHALELELSALEQEQKLRASFTALTQTTQQTTKALNEAKHEAKRLTDTAVLSEQHLARTQRSWHLSQAAALAAKLKDNQPCPVCGSTDHPEPAKPSFEITTEEQLQDAQDRLSSDQAQAQTAQSSLASLVRQQELEAEQLAALESQISSSASTLAANQLGAFTELLEHKQSAVTQAKQEQRLLETLEKDSEQLKSQVLSLEKQQERLEVEGKALSSKLAELDQQIQSLQAKLPDQFSSQSSVAAFQAQTQSRLNQAEASIRSINQQVNQHASALHAAAQQQEDLQLRAKEAAKIHEASAQAFHEALKASVFETKDQCISFSLDQTKQTQLIEQIKQHEQQLAATKARHHSLTQLLSGAAKPDLEQLQIKLNEQQQHTNALQDTLMQHSAELHSLKDASDQLSQLTGDLLELEVRQRSLSHLNTLASGKDKKRISFHRFVLGKLLDSVLEAANLRLIHMTRGRYQLIRNQEEAKGQAARGLELNVFDSFSGSQRSASSLSGGESFLAALALALGLCDTVQQNTGGVRMDTLFVDEGFGSLDTESLELAVATLTELQLSGRTVGIISHVEELKAQLARRIEVSSEQGVSSLHIKAG